MWEGTVKPCDYEIDRVSECKDNSYDHCMWRRENVLDYVICQNPDKTENKEAEE